MRLFWLMGQGFRSRAGRSVAALVAIAVLLVAANVVAQRYLTLRLDLTAEHLYTLARGTRQTLDKIDEPITLRLYYSNRLGDASPSYGTYAQRVRELLDQYAAAAHGKLRLEVYDPQPYSDAEDRAVGYGLQPVPLNDQGEAVYFGLAGTNSTDDQQVIPFFDPNRERFLEYDLTRLIHALAQPKRTRVGLLSMVPLDSDPTATLQGKASQPLAIISQLRQVDDVENLSPDIEAIPKNIDVLMLVQPQKLSDRTLFAIDQYVLKGGKAIVFADPYSELGAGLAAHAKQADDGPPATAFEDLFKAWGVKLLTDVVAGDRFDARRVAVPVEGKPPQTMNYVGWIDLPAANLNHDDVITADLQMIAMASAGILEPIEGAATKFEPLIQTSTDSEKIPVDKVKGLPDVATLLAEFRTEQRKFTLAARITGDVATAFPAGKPTPPPAPPDHGAVVPPQPPEPPAAPGDVLKRSVQPINVVIVADSDMLDDRFWAQVHDFYGQRTVEPVANNADFLANAVEVLAGGEDLVGLRSRGTVARPFEVVERIQRKADDRYAAEQRSLQQKLKQAQDKLHSLTTGEGAGNANAVTAEQTKEIDKFRADMLATRQQLRQVQAAARKDIGDLKVVLEFFDIALMPVVVVAAAFVIAALRRRRRVTVSRA